ncbi:ammonia-dependent NAD(+) synthetase [Salicibibacter halophilus]|uniref:NH(3)-dependent NAD(+) synthetase n=1 Tax=Salicibibacter halophilus TaxID=2502791 RepID=A0A514LE51_9BACI|nr:ammonia-dependent NAD(+) synthetase [Salicibibacter halophilus]QDI90120.1 ammonia-dependent NAD(+) synthetase [Salicibibacter halophilus]
MQQEIIRALNVQPTINPDEEYQKRKEFLKSYVNYARAKGFVLGISGGQDSTLLGKMAQDAVKELREEEKGHYQFIALRLPHGEQHDEDDANKALAFIQPDRTETINIQPAVDASAKSFAQTFDKELNDFHKGNTKARERMKVQYDVAASFGLLVIGTDHAAEAITGYFTKHGDGACDIVPLYGLNKRQGKELLQMLGAPASTYKKTPTADLEDGRPGLSDEEALGMTYDEIDDFLEGKKVSDNVENKLIHYYRVTEHKRRTPVSPQDEWWKKI